MVSTARCLEFRSSTGLLSLCSAGFLSRSWLISVCEFLSAFADWLSLLCRLLAYCHRSNGLGAKVVSHSPKSEDILGCCPLFLQYVCVACFLVQVYLEANPWSSSNITARSSRRPKACSLRSHCFGFPRCARPRLTRNVRQHHLLNGLP